MRRQNWPSQQLAVHQRRRIDRRLLGAGGGCLGSRGELRVGGHPFRLPPARGVGARRPAAPPCRSPWANRPDCSAGISPTATVGRAGQPQPVGYLVEKPEHRHRLAGVQRLGAEQVTTVDDDQARSPSGSVSRKSSASSTARRRSRRRCASTRQRGSRSPTAKPRAEPAQVHQSRRAAGPRLPPTANGGAAEGARDAVARSAWTAGPSGRPGHGQPGAVPRMSARVGPRADRNLQPNLEQKPPSPAPGPPAPGRRRRAFTAGARSGRRRAG